jgi:AcrR family transcriptional regulator
MASPTQQQRSAPVSRRERTLATRRRMLAAAYRLFCANGYVPTTMQVIAAEAGVAVQTLYFTFHTKGAVLGEVLGAAIVGFDEWTKTPADPIVVDTLIGMHDWTDDFKAEPDAREALALFVAHGAEIHRRVGPLVAAMHAASGDPEVAAVLALADQRRADFYRWVVEGLAQKSGGLRPGLSEDRATDVLLVLFSAETYHALTAGRGWSHGETTSFLAELLTQQMGM